MSQKALIHKLLIHYETMVSTLLLDKIEAYKLLRACSTHVGVCFCITEHFKKNLQDSEYWLFRHAIRDIKHNDCSYWCATPTRAMSHNHMDLKPLLLYRVYLLRIEYEWHRKLWILAKWFKPKALSYNQWRTINP